MNRFFFGLVVGIPVGMLLADVLAARTPEVEQRIREAVAEDLEKARPAADLPAAEVVDRVAMHAREGASRERETAVLNQVTREELLAVPGIGPKLAQRILDGRPYRYDHEVVERKILNRPTFEQLHRQVIENHERSA